MSASNKSGGCKKCEPCGKSKNGKKNRKSSGTGAGSGSGSITCPGSAGSSSGLGGDIADDMDCNFAKDCKDDVAKKINEKLCNALGNPLFSPEKCYECDNLQATANGSCNCNKFEGDIIVSPGDLATSCREIDCGAQPVN